eukprot:CAMPEP_0117636212 /NCGR_PEP_ID=MMETSP0802-20121206/6654_1 /TAXON_ID=38833 /ORGANISM="Micromonas sp., Strain CCMP2099" /LENGTH=282 /DNA_ID=CAMNT_0005441025 /DNA_START=536 /DNA_END=1380 /DNA_ORIENTATION=-
MPALALGAQMPSITRDDLLAKARHDWRSGGYAHCGDPSADFSSASEPSRCALSNLPSKRSASIVVGRVFLSTSLDAKPAITAATGAAVLANGFAVELPPPVSPKGLAAVFLLPGFTRSSALNASVLVTLFWSSAAARGTRGLPRRPSRGLDLLDSRRKRKRVETQNALCPDATHPALNAILQLVPHFQMTTKAHLKLLLRLFELFLRELATPVVPVDVWLAPPVIQHGTRNFRFRHRDLRDANLDLARQALALQLADIRASAGGLATFLIHETRGRHARRRR